MEKDVYVYSAVPPRSKTALRHYGLLSANRVLDYPAILRKARPDKKDREAFIKRVQKGLKSERPEGFLGPSVFFTEVDPAKIRDDHFIKIGKLEFIKINLTHLLEDMPETIIFGVELEPVPDMDWGSTDFMKYVKGRGFKSPEAFWKARRQPLSLSEVKDYTKRSPKALWKKYDVERHTGHYYAANVPHAFIITPTGHIPFKYIQYV